VRRACALAIAGLALVAAGCNDGGGVTSVEETRRGISPAVASVTAPITTLTHPQLISSATSLRNVTCIRPIHRFSSFDVGAKPSEFVEGAVFAGTVEPGGVTGTVRLVGFTAAANTAAVYWPPAGTTIGPVRGVAIDTLEYDGSALPGYTADQGLLKGRLWVAAGSILHVLAGRDDLTAFRRPIELAEVTLTASIPAGETLLAITDAPPGLALYAATATRVFRIIPAADASASRVETLIDVPETADGQRIFAVAADSAGRVYVAQARAAPGAFTFKRIENAALVTTPTAALDLTLLGSALTSPTAIAINSDDHLVVAERATATLYEFDRDGVFVTSTAAVKTNSLPPNAPNVFTGDDTPIAVAPGELVTFDCDRFMSRMVLFTVSGTSGFMRTMANVSFRGAIMPFIQNRCTLCHTTAAPQGGIDFTGEPSEVLSILLRRACQTFSATDTARPADCDLPRQSQFLNPAQVDPNRVFDQPAEICPNCPYPPMQRIEPFDPANSYVVRKLLATRQLDLTSNAASFGIIRDPPFTNNCASVPTDTASTAGAVCGERMPLASYVQRPLRRVEIELLEKWIRLGAPDD
jgi:hypothetical protein